MSPTLGRELAEQEMLRHLSLIRFSRFQFNKLSN